MDVVADQYHSAIFHVFLHCPSKASLSIFCQFVSFINNKDLKGLSTLGFYVGVGSNLLYNILNDMPVIVLVVGWSHFDVIVTSEQTILNCCRSILRLKNPLLLF